MKGQTIAQLTAKTLGSVFVLPVHTSGHARKINSVQGSVRCTVG